jgi:citronellol/citronellal dehydrogenase
MSRYIATLAVANSPDFESMLARSRDPQIMGDAAAEIFSRPAAEVNGKCYVDSAALVESGVTNLSGYGGGDDPILDIFVDNS